MKIFRKKAINYASAVLFCSIWFIPQAKASVDPTGTYWKDECGQYCDGAACDCTTKIVIVSYPC